MCDKDSCVVTPTPGVGFSCFACLKQTTTSVFTSYFCLCVKTRGTKGYLGSPNHCKGVLSSLFSWTGARALFAKRERRGESGRGAVSIQTQKVMTERMQKNRSIAMLIHMSTYALRHRWMGFSSKWKHRSAFLCKAGTHWRSKNQLKRLESETYFLWGFFLFVLCVL